MHTKLKIISEHYFVSTYLLVQLFEFLEVAGRSVSFNLLADIQLKQFVFRSHSQLQELIARKVAYWLLLQVFQAAHIEDKYFIIMNCKKSPKIIYVIGKI